jgi:hypothetical protein
LRKVFEKNGLSLDFGRRYRAIRGGWDAGFFELVKV